MKPEIDVSAELAAALDKYGCSQTEAGWRRFAIILAGKAGEISLSPEPDPSCHAPPHRLDNKMVGQLMSAHREANPNATHVESSKAVEKTLAASGLRLGANSIRVMDSRFRKQVRDLVERGHLKSENAIAAASLCADDDTTRWLDRNRRLRAFEMAAAEQTSDPSGLYKMPFPVRLNRDQTLTAIRLRQRSYSHPRGQSPRFRNESAVSILVRSRPKEASWMSDDYMPAGTCTLESTSFMFAGVVEEATSTLIEGSIDRDTRSLINVVVQVRPKGRPAITTLIPQVARDVV